MLRILQDEAEIRKGQAAFETSMKLMAEQSSDKVVGWPGDSRPEHVNFSSKLGIWWVMREHEEGRFWNVFGITQRDSRLGDIKIEINFPLRGIRRQVKAALASDESGRVFVLHRGGLGGSKAGKSLLNYPWKGREMKVQDGDRVSTLILIGALDEADFPYKVAEFVRRVGQIRTN
jgi:hypothetical protein